MNFIPEDEVYLTTWLESLKAKRTKLLNEVNKKQAVVDISTFSTPPDYIFYLAEAIGVCTGQIPTRTFSDDPHSRCTKEQRWVEIQDMFRDHAVILKMFDLEPRKLHPGNFYLLDILHKDHQDLIEKAKKK